MKGGEKVKIGPGNCCRDGGGACPNGNCLDNNGRRGVIIREEVFTCRWFCGHRPGEKVKIGPGNCWRGGGCPNGNCLDNNGRRGVIIREEVFTCRWFCGHRPKCRYQTCCQRLNQQWKKRGHYKGRSFHLPL